LETGVFVRKQIIGIRVPDQVNCVDLVNETNKQIWLWAMPSPVTEGILAFRGQQAAVDNRFCELLNPKLPHAINFSPAKPKPELKAEGK